MRKRLIAAIALLICLATCLASRVQAQNTITTVAGGVPNNTSALSVGLQPQSVFKDVSGNLYITDEFCSCVFKVASNGQLTTVAGNGSYGFTGDGGLATSAQLSSPSSISVDSAGNIYITDEDNDRVREVVAATGIIQTVAGNGTFGFSGDGGAAISAELSTPTGVSVDSAGNIFIADDGNNRIRKVTAGTGIIQTVAGNGTPGFAGDGGLATGAEISHPFGVFVDSTGNIFIADSNQRIREVSSGNIQTVAGNGTPGFAGDGGLATSAELQDPSGVFVDASGNIFIADDGNNRIRKVTAGTGIIQTVAGNGNQGFAGDGGAATSAELNDPLNIFVDTSGNILIADVENVRIREVASGTGIIQTVAGNGTLGFDGDGGPATSAQLAGPDAVAADRAGNLYITDTDNSRIREVIAGTGIIQTVAGNGTLGFGGDGGPATSAQLQFPEAVAFDRAGNLYIADTFNQRIREVVAATGAIQTVAGNGTAGFSGDGGPATSADLNYPTGVAVDGSGNIFIEDTGNDRIREVVAATGAIQTVAGNGTAGFSGDGGPAIGAEVSITGCPGTAIYVDNSGNLFIADTNNNRIREVLAATGIIQTVVGSGAVGESGGGFTGDGGSAKSALLNAPAGVFVDDAGNIFISDNFNNRVREVLAATAIIQTVAGNGVYGFNGDGGPATSAEFDGPYGLAGDGSGNLFIADLNNNRIRKVTGLAAIAVPSVVGDTQAAATTAITGAGLVVGTVTQQSSSTVAAGLVIGESPVGTSEENPGAVVNLVVSSGPSSPGPAAQNSIVTVAGGGGPITFSTNICIPTYFGGIFQGNYYIRSCRQIFKVTPQGQWTLLAGNGAQGFSGDGGPAINASLSIDVIPGGGFFVDGSGNVFIADTNNQRVREVFAATGIIQTIAGNGTPGFSGDGGLATSAMLDAPEGVYVDNSGDLFIADTDNCRIREVIGGVISTVVGTSSCGFSGDGGPATSARLSFPANGWIDSSGNGYIADTGNNRIREISASTGIIQTVAGTGTSGYNGDGASAISANLSNPYGVFVDGAGDIFITDSGNSRIREVVGGIIHTVAGGISGYTGDGGPAVSAGLAEPLNVFVDGSGNIFIADFGGIREVVAATGNIQTLIGNNAFGYSGDSGAATSGQLFEPESVTTDRSGNIFFADSGNFRIRKVVAASGVIKTVAGTGVGGFSGDGGPATSARISPFGGIVVDSSGNIFFSDFLRVREIVSATGNIQTVAGNGTAGFSGDGGPATSAQLNNASSSTALALDSFGNIFIADSGNNRIREVVAATGIIKTVAGNGTSGFSGDGGPATSAEFNVPTSVVVDSLGDIFIADNDNNRVREVVAATGNIQSVAGTATRGHTGDGGAATSAEIAPNVIALDSAGNLFIGGASGNPFVRAVSAATGIIQTVAGNGLVGFSGDGGPATSAALNFYGWVGVSPAGGLLIGDTLNARVRYVVPGPAPSISNVSPNVTPQGVGVTLTVTGTNFVSGAAVTFNGKAEATSFISATQLIATVPSSDVATLGTYAIAAANPPLGGGIANGANLTVQSAVGISISSPASASVTVNAGSSLQFSAVVTNTTNTAVTWQVNGITGGNATFGTISTSGLYTAPNAVPSPSSFSVTAISVTDPTKSASVTVTIQSAVGISISSPTAPITVDTGLSFQFSAAITGTTNMAVTWQVNSVTGGNTTFGTISTSGLYVAPGAVPSPASFKVTAISVADPTKSASATVTIAVASSAAPVSLQISPQPASVVVGSSAVQFAAVVLNAGTDTSVTWSLVSGAGTGSINASSGVYTPPATPPTGNVTIQATSVADPTKNQQISFTIAIAALAFAPGQSPMVPAISSQSGGNSSVSLVLNLASNAGAGAFNLTCDQMPPGAACNVAPTSVTTLGGQQSLQFRLTVIATVASSKGLPTVPDDPRTPMELLALATLGSLFIFLWTRAAPLRRTHYACLMVLLICCTLAFLAACSGISPTTVPSPVVPSVRVGTVIPARVTATPTNTSGGFTATQMIVPFPVTQ